MPLSYKSLSIVIPVYNEAASLGELLSEIKKVIKKYPAKWEVIFVNDGSTDDSRKVIVKLAQGSPWLIHLINFHKNQGKAAALRAGFKKAQGEVIITLDADLQDDPSEIPHLLAKLDQGWDLVSGYKKNRRDPFHKTIPSRCFNALTGYLSGLKLKDINSGFKAYRSEVAKNLNIYGELYRFIPVLADNSGHSVTEIAVNHRSRRYGMSKYGVTRMVRGFLDLMTIIFLTRFIKRPLHLFGSIGLFLFVLGLLICGYLSFIHFAYNERIGTRPLLLLGVLLILTGVQLISTGLIAELITYYAQKRELQQTLDKNDLEQK